MFGKGSINLNMNMFYTQYSSLESLWSNFSRLNGPFLHGFIKEFPSLSFLSRMPRKCWYWKIHLPTTFGGGGGANNDWTRNATNFDRRNCKQNHHDDPAWIIRKIRSSRQHSLPMHAVIEILSKKKSSIRANSYWMELIIMRGARFLRETYARH